MIDIRFIKYYWCLTWFCAFVRVHREAGLSDGEIIFRLRNMFKFPLRDTFDFVKSVR